MYKLSLCCGMSHRNRAVAPTPVITAPRLADAEEVQDESAAVFVKLLGAADYVEVRILIPPVGNGFGLKRAAVSAIFEGGEDAPLLKDVTLHRVQNANAEFPTDDEERLAQQTLFPTSRLVGRDMHNTRFLLVVATADNLSRGDCCSISFWCRSKQSLERWIIIALAVAMTLVGALAKRYWG